MVSWINEDLNSRNGGVEMGSGCGTGRRCSQPPPRCKCWCSTWGSPQEMENGVGASWAQRNCSTCTGACLLCPRVCWAFSESTRAPGCAQLCKNLPTDAANALPLQNPCSLCLVLSSSWVLSLSMCQTEHIWCLFVLFVFKEVHVSSQSYWAASNLVCSQHSSPQRGWSWVLREMSLNSFLLWLGTTMDKCLSNSFCSSPELSGGLKHFGPITPKGSGGFSLAHLYFNILNCSFKQKSCQGSKPSFKQDFLPNSSCCIVANTPHCFPKTTSSFCPFKVKSFLKAQVLFLWFFTVLNFAHWNGFSVNYVFPPSALHGKI